MPNGTTLKLIELYIEERGPCSVDEVSRELDIPKITLYPVVTRPVNDDRVQRDGDTLCYS